MDRANDKYAMRIARLFFILLAFGSFIAGPLGCGKYTGSTASSEGPVSETFSVTYEVARPFILRKGYHYVLHIRPDGMASFEMFENGKPQGVTETKLNAAQRNAIAEAIRASNFFSLLDSYTHAGDNCPAWGTDGASITITVSMNGRQKTIRHNTGCSESGENIGKVYPPQLVALEESIERIVNVEALLPREK